MNAITVTTEVNASIETIWQLWNGPEHIMQWNVMSDDWHCPHAENDPKTGGRFNFVMALKDGSFSFDFAGVYTDVIANQLMSYKLDDGRRSTILFTGSSPVRITETFEPNVSMPSEDQQRACQSVLNNFKMYAEKALVSS
ncbi:polyketide cyclase [Mucilaginibacter terrenus]|uniref:Polyketide cyclase n=1 Tax=Mucilaginibacter terrenus TaxID=2482727 RepID=A0A3E2NVA3_9SPHI|nr:SRPBCC domain-containing protein [Mucilaginibacter terrenus]RFZ84938.1 polyketide cyclase [Mucilaginibacter terrenus]